MGLGEIESGSGVALLAPLMRDPVLDVRLTALWAIGEIEAHDSVDVVAPALKDPDPAVRRMAAWALGEIESSAAVGILTPLLRDPEDDVRTIAAWALGEIESASPCRRWRPCATIGPLGASRGPVGNRQHRRPPLRWALSAGPLPRRGHDQRYAR